MVKAAWEGISGGRAAEDAVAGFFDGLRPGRRRRERRRPSRRRAAAPSWRSRSLGAEPVAATPPRRRCASASTSSEPSGARSTRSRCGQIHVEPARRAYDDETRERLATVRRARALAARRRARSCGRRSTCSCRASPARRRSTLDGALHLRPRGRRAKYFAALADGEVPLAFHFNGTVHYRGRGRPAADRPDAVGAARRASRMPVAAWQRDDRAPTTRPRLGPAAGRDARRAAPAKARAGRCHPSTRSSPALLEEADERTLERARRLAAVRGLRALPLHAGRDQERDADAVRHRLPAGLRGRRARRPSTTAARSASRSGPARRCAAEVRFLQAAGERHQASSAASTLAGAGRGATFAFDGLDGRAGCAPRTRRPDAGDACAVREHDRGRRRRRRAPRRCDALAALDPRRRCARRGGRFISPLERRDGGCENVNTWPVLATPDDDACSARRSCCPTTRRSRRRAAGPLRRHRDRGGAAAARPGAQRRRARGDRRAGPDGARDDRARRRGDARGHLALHGA